MNSHKLEQIRYIKQSVKLKHRIQMVELCIVGMFSMLVSWLIIFAVAG